VDGDCPSEDVRASRQDSLSRSTLPGVGIMDHSRHALRVLPWSRGWFPLAGLPLQPIREIPVPAIFRIPRNRVSVVVVERFDYEFTLIVRDIHFHTVER
jgi:hypothetical protein